MKKTKRSKPPPRIKPAATDSAWTATKHAELTAREGVIFVYLLTDEDGAALLAQGTVPEYLKVQARRALEWHLCDVPDEKAS